MATICCRSVAALDKSSSSLARRLASSSQVPESIAAAVADALCSFGEAMSGVVSGDRLEEEEDDEDDEEEDEGDEVDEDGEGEMTSDSMGLVSALLSSGGTGWGDLSEIGISTSLGLSSSGFGT